MLSKFTYPALSLMSLAALMPYQRHLETFRQPRNFHNVEWGPGGPY
jgi:hypothetical protein